ncbi:hypothetical protein [Prosthecobacter fluviatilis]|uniref:Uncharacterized protein n=1 Tax=Prosthecobacter fluviatilis TaxID=445931 RepID=A0ABW0KVA1_9BACT
MAVVCDGEPGVRAGALLVSARGDTSTDAVPAGGASPWVVVVSAGGSGPLELAVKDVVLPGVPTLSVFPAARGRASVAWASSSAFAVVG